MKITCPSCEIPLEKGQTFQVMLGARLGPIDEARSAVALIIGLGDNCRWTAGLRMFICGVCRTMFLPRSGQEEEWTARFSDQKEVVAKVEDALKDREDAADRAPSTDE